MIQITFQDDAMKRKALGKLAGRFHFKSWATGDMLVPASALSYLAVEGVTFRSKALPTMSNSPQHFKLVRSLRIDNGEVIPNEIEAMSTDTRRFTILEHQWNGIHWDFLVEDGPMLRSWAIDEPLIAGHQLRARSLPAHRRIYLDYEGEISEGRGTVTRWDSGTCDVREWGEDQVRIEVRGGQIEGLVEFRCTVFEGVRRWEVCLGKLS